MSAESSDQLQSSGADAIDLEVMDDASAGGFPDGMSPEDIMKMGPQMLVQAFRDMLKEKLKRWFIRSLIWATVLLFFAQEHGWARWVFGIWAFIAGIHLAFLLYGWYASGKQGDKLAQMFAGMQAPPAE